MDGKRSGDESTNTLASAIEFVPGAAGGLVDG
jgi:hypothetical protein